MGGQGGAHHKISRSVSIVEVSLDDLEVDKIPGVAEFEGGGIRRRKRRKGVRLGIPGVAELEGGGIRRRKRR